MELVKIILTDSDEHMPDNATKIHYGICANGCSDEVGIWEIEESGEIAIETNKTDLGFLEITETAWNEIMPHHEDDEGELAEIIARLLNRMDYDFTRFFRYILYESWPEIKTDISAEIKIYKGCIDLVKKETDGLDVDYDQKWINLYKDQIDRLQWISSADDAMIVGLMKDSLSHVAKMMESDMVDDTGHSIN